MNAAIHQNYYACLTESEAWEKWNQNTFTCVDCGETRFFYDCIRWDDCETDRCKACPELGHHCGCSPNEHHAMTWDEKHRVWVIGSEYQSHFDKPYPAAAWRAAEAALEAHPESWEMGKRIRIEWYSDYINQRGDMADAHVILVKGAEGWTRIIAYQHEWSTVEPYDIDLVETDWLPLMETMGPEPYPLWFRYEGDIQVNPESGIRAYDPLGLLSLSVEGYDRRWPQHQTKARLVSLPPSSWWASAKEQIEFDLAAYIYPLVREGETVLLTERTVLLNHKERRADVPYTVRYEMEYLEGTWSPLLVIQEQRRGFLCYTYDTNDFPVSLPEF